MKEDEPIKSRMVTRRIQTELKKIAKTCNRRRTGQLGGRVAGAELPVILGKELEDNRDSTDIRREREGTSAMSVIPVQSESPTAPTAAKPKLRRRRFCLRALMFGVVLATLAMSWFAVRMHRATEQRAAIDELNKFEDAFIWYDCQVENNCGLGPEENNTPRGPAWLRGLLGDDFFNDVTRVNLSGTETDDDLMRSRVSKATALAAARNASDRQWPQAPGAAHQFGTPRSVRPEDHRRGAGAPAVVDRHPTA